VFGDGDDRAAQISRALLVSRAEKDQFVGLLGRFGDEFHGVNFEHGAESVATLARAVGRVEREGARFERRDVDAAIHAGHALRIHLLFAVDDGDEHRAVRQLQSRADGFGETFVDARFN
jgi:hypothetical protein